MTMEIWLTMARLRLAGAVLAGLLIVLPGASSRSQETGDLPARIGAMAGAEGFKVTGLELLEPAPAPQVAESGSLKQRLTSLLAGYNFVLFHDSAGRVSAVRILGRGRTGPPALREATVPATRNGLHYLVDAVLIGPTGLWANRRLILDTGASTVVLPVSEIGALGLREFDLAPTMVETAGGKVPARAGTLAAVRVGHAEVKDVDVTFIADEHLGQAALLGMSFLDHFRVTIDDAAQRIVLVAK